MRSLLSVEQWPSGPLPPDKYPEGWHLIAGSFEKAAGWLLLGENERRAIAELGPRLGAELVARANDPTFDISCALQQAGDGLEGAVGRLVLAGRIATLLLAFVLSLAASEVASALAGPRFGWIAGLAIGLMPATVHYAATLNTDVPAVAWCALAWAFAVNGARAAGDARSSKCAATFIACGAAMGLAAATKDQLVGALPGVLCFALWRRGHAVEGSWPRWKRLGAIAIGALAAYLLASGILHGATWRQHVDFVLGKGSQPYREFPFTLVGALGLLKATGDALLLAGGYVGGAGVLLLLVTAILRKRFGALRLLLPALSYVALFLFPAGYVYPRFALPILLCSAVALAWSIANVAGTAERRKRVLLGGLVGLWGLGEASGVIDAKWSDARPVAVAALAAQRAPGDEVWICSQPWLFAPFPPIAAPHRFVTLQELAAGAQRGDPPPRFLWLAVEAHLPLATREVLEATAQQLKMTLLERFETHSSAPFANDRNGLLLPVVALFTAKP